MTEETANMLNRLIQIEDELQMLWDFHPDNPDVIDVVSRFVELQRDASSIESYLQEKGVELDEDVI